jgi:hypothetical protein
MRTPTYQEVQNWTDPSLSGTPQIVDGRRVLNGRDLGLASPLDLSATCQQVVRIESGRASLAPDPVLHSRFTQAQRRRAMGDTTTTRRTEP